MRRYRTTALDSLVDDGQVTPGQRFVVKLDVEGVPSLDSKDEARRMCPRA